MVFDGADKKLNVDFKSFGTKMLEIRPRISLMALLLLFLVQSLLIVVSGFEEPPTTDHAKANLDSEPNASAPQTNGDPIAFNRADNVNMEEMTNEPFVDNLETLAFETEETMEYDFSQKTTGQVIFELNQMLNNTNNRSIERRLMTSFAYLQSEAEESRLDQEEEQVQDDKNQEVQDQLRKHKKLNQISRAKSSVLIWSEEDGPENEAVRLLKQMLYGMDVSNTTRLDKTTKLLSRLVEQAENGDTDALFYFGELCLFRFWPCSSAKRPLRIFRHLANQGNATAQYYTGFLLSTGVADTINISESLFYHHLASENGDIRSQATLGYYYDHGIGVPQSCEKASYFYRKVAMKLLEWYRQGPVGRREIILHAYHYADDDGGLYGIGASVGGGFVPINKFNSNKEQLKNIDHIMDYMNLIGNSGDPEPHVNLAHIHYYGGRTIKPNFEQARESALRIVRVCWNADHKYIGSEKNLQSQCGNAAALMGTLYLRGEGVNTNYTEAMDWFKKGAKLENPRCLYNLGTMELHGLDVPNNMTQAVKYFQKAAELHSHLAHAALGKIELQNGNFESAFEYFTKSNSAWDPEALFLLAEMVRRGLGSSKDCSSGLRLYKTVLEIIEEPLYKFEQANELLPWSDNRSLLLQMMAAEMGHEAGQFNTAYLLDTQIFYSILLNNNQPVEEGFEKMIFKYYSRSAHQLNTDSLVRIGDMCIQGRGHAKDSTSAYEHYKLAAAKSAQAAWNLGWMHENGIGVIQDFALARKFYKLALGKSRSAYLPVILSLIKLEIRSVWGNLLHGTTHRDVSQKRLGPMALLKALRKRWISEVSGERTDDTKISPEKMNKNVGGPFRKFSETIPLLIISIIFFLLNRARQNRRRGAANQGNRNGDQAAFVDQRGDSALSANTNATNSSSVPERNDSSLHSSEEISHAYE